VFDILLYHWMLLLDFCHGHSQLVSWSVIMEGHEGTSGWVFMHIFICVLGCTHGLTPHAFLSHSIRGGDQSGWHIIGTIFVTVKWANIFLQTVASMW